MLLAAGNMGLKARFLSVIRCVLFHSFCSSVYQIEVPLPLFVRVAVVILDILSAMLKYLLISMPLGALLVRRKWKVEKSGI